MAGLVANPRLRRPNRVLPRVVIRCIAFALLGSLTPLCGAQAVASSSPTFVVATIKPSDPNGAGDDGRIGFSPGGSFDAMSQSLKELIEFVQDFGYYDVDQRIVGGPKWISSAKFDIAAKCDEETARAFAAMSLKQQVREEQIMVQALLTDRFRLRTHHETRRLAVYALVQVKGGLKMKPSAKAGAEDPGSAEGAPGNWRGDSVTMAELAGNLSALPEIGGRIVTDQTGLRGRFDFTLKWTPDPTMGAMPPGPDSVAEQGSAAPLLLTALQEQLGLRLEMTKEPVDMIVVDSAELPTPN